MTDHVCSAVELECTGTASLHLSYYLEPVGSNGSTSPFTFMDLPLDGRGHVYRWL